MHIQAFILFVQFLGKCQRSFWVHLHHVSQLFSVIDLEVVSRSIIRGLLQSTLLVQNSNHLGVGFAFAENLQSKSLIELANHISQLDATLELAARCPGLHQIDFTLSEDWSA